MKYEIQPRFWDERYNGFLSNYANKRVPKNMVDDLVQDTFLSGLCSAKNFKFLCHEKYWLLSILKRKIVDYYRSANSKKGLLFEKSISLTDSEAFHIQKIGSHRLRSNSVESELTAKELEEEIANAVKSLSPSRRTIFELRRKGVKTPEICEILNIKQSYCWVEICKARKEIKDHLRHYWDAA